MRGLPLLLVVLGAACAGSAGSELDGAEGASGDLVPSVEVEVAPSSIRLLLHVTNVGSRPVTFRFPTSQRFDFDVETPAGERVWRWSDGRSFLQVLSEATLAPGETWDMEAVWATVPGAGRYVARGRLVSMGGGVEQEAPFEVQ